MKSKNQKIQELQDLATKLPKATIAVITSFARMGEKGLSVAQMQELKRALKAMNGEYLVTKKTLMDIVFKKNGFDGADVYGMEGSLGLAIGSDDPYVLAKKLYEFSKKKPQLKFDGAVFEGKYIAHEAFLAIAQMPSKETLIARLLGMINYPVRSLAIVLDQIAKQKGNITT